jgi:hypothetical protein
MDKTALINAIKELAFNEENFEMLKEELIKSVFPKSISEQVEDAMSGIDRNFQEDMINDMDMGQDETIERTYY